MSSPTPEAVDKIKAKVSDWSGTDAAIAAQLNTELVANPVAAPQILPPLSMMAMAQKVSQATATAIINWPNLDLLKREVDKGERQATLNWVELLAYCGLVTAPEALAIKNYFTTKIADPAHPVQLPWSKANLGRELDADDIAAARPEA